MSRAAYKREYGRAARQRARELRLQQGTWLDRESLPGEEWRDIPGARGYQASTEGRIRSVDREDAIGRVAYGRVLRAHRCPRGYLSVHVDFNGKHRTTSVHKLVALSFHGLCPEGKEVAHNDGQPFNCRPDNLRYATHVENEADKDAHGTKFVASGERNGHAKLSLEKVSLIRSELASGAKQAQLARQFGVDPSLISHIKRGVHWREAGDDHGV